MSSYYTATNDGIAQSCLQCACGSAGFIIAGLSPIGQCQAAAAYLAGYLTTLTAGNAQAAMISRAEANGWSIPGFLSDLGQVQTVAAQLAGFSVTPTSDGMAQAAMVSAGNARGISFAGLGKQGSVALMLANLIASTVSYSPGGTNYPALTATRASAAQYLDSTEAWQSAATNVVRSSAYQYDNGTTAWERITLLEMAATNLVLQSDALATTWTATGSPTRTNAVGTYAGRPFSRLAYATNWATDRLVQTVTFTGDGVKALSILAKQDGANAGTFSFGIYDGTAAAYVATLTLTVAAGGAISGTAPVGTLIKTVALADGVYRFDVQTAAVTAAHTNQIYLGIGAGTTCPSILLSGVQASDNLVPSSLVPTTTATVTRAADVAYLDLAGTALATPRESTWYVKFIELGNVLLTSSNFPRVLEIGDQTSAGTNTLFVNGNNSGKYSVQWFNGSSSTTAVVAAASAALNDQVELLVYVDATGKVHLTQALNGVAAATVDGVDTQAFAASFVNTKVYLNSKAAVANFGLMGLQAFKAAPGKQTLATMRNLP